MPSTDPRFPIGPFTEDKAVTPAKRAAWIAQIAEAPAVFRSLVAALPESALDTRYREGGWTVRQVVHHVFDSHANAYVRFRLGLTEDVPRIKAYNEAAWAELPDAKTGPVEMSLVLLEALHRRWVALLESMTEEQFRREIDHPESGRQPLDRVLQIYAWHGRHHAGHIASVRNRVSG
jgi:uncharacterized damage-inducible protein DinB